MNNTHKLAGAASILALAFGLSACDVNVDLDKAYCDIDDGAKYPVRVIDAKDGSIIREGGYKRFDIDHAARTCTYMENSGDAFVYKMKPESAGTSVIKNPQHAGFFTPETTALALDQDTPQGYIIKGIDGEQP